MSDWDDVEPTLEFDDYDDDSFDEYDDDSYGDEEGDDVEYDY